MDDTGASLNGTKSKTASPTLISGNDTMPPDKLDYPNLTDFMQKCLFQMAAESFAEAIRVVPLSGDKEWTKSITDELQRLLSAGYSEEDLAAFTWKFCDYFHGNTARSTLEYILEVLKSED